MSFHWEFVQRKWDSFLSHVRDCPTAWLYIRLSLPKKRGEREEGLLHPVSQVHVLRVLPRVYGSCDFRSEDAIKVLEICVPLCSHRPCLVVLDFIRRETVQFLDGSRCSTSTRRGSRG